MYFDIRLGPTEQHVIVNPEIKITVDSGCGTYHLVVPGGNGDDYKRWIYPGSSKFLACIA